MEVTAALVILTSGATFAFVVYGAHWIMDKLCEKYLGEEEE